jgi:hypothetical protein
MCKLPRYVKVACRDFNLFFMCVPSLEEIRRLNLKLDKTQWNTSAIFIIYSTEQQRFCDCALRFRFQNFLKDGMLLTESGEILKDDWGFTPIQFPLSECRQQVLHKLLLRNKS